MPSDAIESASPAENDASQANGTQMETANSAGAANGSSGPSQANADAENASRPMGRTHKYAPALKIPAQYAQVLHKLGKDEALTYISKLRQILAPYEMRQAVNPQGTSAMAEQYWTRHVPGIEGWRNVLVVLPLTITWLSLGLAALAYEQSLPKLKNTTAPDFFQLWQQGFPNLTVVHFGHWTIPLIAGGLRYLTFTDVAFLDVLILLLMLLLTGISQFIIGAAAKNTRMLEVWLNQQLHTLSTESVVWSLSPSEQQPRWAAEVQTAINALNEALDSVSSSVNAFKVELIDQGETVRKAVAQTGAVPAAVNDLVKVYQHAIEAQSLLQSALPSIETNLKSVADSQMLTAADWTRMTEELGLAITSVRRLADMLGGTNDLETMAERIRSRYTEALNRRRATRPLNRFFTAAKQRWPFGSR